MTKKLYLLPKFSDGLPLKMNTEEKTRLTRLFNLANRKQSEPEWEQWALITKQALSYVLHGDESLRAGIELELEKENL
jgi:hypothetical protein